MHGNISMFRECHVISFLQQPLRAMLFSSSEEEVAELSSLSLTHGISK